MNNRRRFILQSGLATAAFVAAKPIQAFANYSSPLTGVRFNFNHITFLHTAGGDSRVLALVKKITEKNTSVVLQHAGNNGEQEQQQLHYDASHQTLNENNGEGYKIVHKDHIKVGIIAVNANEQDVVKRVNDLATRLKEVKDCQFVVCLSQLGYKHKSKTDDLTLAGASENIDIIVGKYASGSPKRPVTAYNKKRAEVVIHHTHAIEAAPGKIKIGLDQFGGKFTISF